MKEKLNENPNNKKKHNRKKIIIIIGIIAILIAIGIFVYAKLIKDNCTNTNLNTNDNGSSIIDPRMRDDKPIIYLYPMKETEIFVNLGYSDKITCSYPQYTTGWNILAKPNGDLIDLNSGRNLYSLYYESTNVTKFDITEDGFIVKGSEVVEFLEEKLATLGLTEREAEEFIIYWLPKLQKNEYNYIRFATIDEINENMPLEINPNPDTIIRILMTYKGLDNPIEIEEQELVTPKRTGFVAVEWGGTEIN